MKIGTMCSGIGAPEVALKNLAVDHRIVFACERDKYARETYEANHNAGRMLLDMETQEWSEPDLYADLCVAGIPCQTFSLAGKGFGESDKRGLLFYDFYKYLQFHKPKVFIIENVTGLISKKHINVFNNWVQLLGWSMNTHINMFNHPDSLHYNLHFKILNALDFGLPQNRDRVFLVGIREDLPNTFRFPAGFPLQKSLVDFLDVNVPEKYYLSETMLSWFKKHSDKKQSEGCGFKFELRDPDGIASAINARTFKMGIDDNYVDEQVVMVSRERRTEDAKAERRQTTDGVSPCITAKSGGGYEPYILVPEATEKGYDIVREGDSIDVKNLGSGTRRGRVGKGIAGTLDTDCRQAVVVKERVRRLTPSECFRLQGFPEDFIKPVSDTQLYKQAGNSIAVPVLEAIFKNLLPILEC